MSVTDVDLWGGAASAAARHFDGPQQGLVTRVEAGRVWFTVPDYDAVIEFGPAPYQRPVPTAEPTVVAGHGGGGDHDAHTHDLLPADAPPRGTPCLALFARHPDGSATPWVVAFDGWPGP